MKRLLALLLCFMLLIPAVAAETAYADTLPTVKDVLLTLDDLLNGGDGEDFNGDGRFSLLDSLRVLQLVIKAEEMPTSGGKLFDAANAFGMYNYCPSVLQLADGTRYVYYCTNKNSLQVIDYVGCRKGTLQADGTYTWGAETHALSPSADAWDSQHVCDPSVIAGDFTYQGEQYGYLMAYLGCVTTNSQDNEVGIAVSKTPEGPFVRVGTEPLVAFDYDANNTAFQWGVGQPSIVSKDKAGEVWLFYTYGDPTVTKTVYSVCDFSNLDAPVLGDEIKVGTAGLKNLNGNGDFLNNADFAYDAEKDRFYCASDCHPHPTDAQPDFISSHFRVSYFGGTDIANAKWSNMANIGEVDTGYPRNHNVGLVRDAYGHILPGDYLTVYYTVSETGTYQWSHLGTYRLHEFHLLILK